MSRPWYRWLMTLGIHAIVGATVANLLPQHPILGFAAALASHFVCDAVPHWDYKLGSYHEDKDDSLKSDLTVNRKAIKDFAKMGLDFGLGIVAALLIFKPAGELFSWITILGIIGGVLPDALAFFYMKVRREPLTTVQRFHIWNHADRKITNPVLGLGLQVAWAAGWVILSFH